MASSVSLSGKAHDVSGSHIGIIVRMEDKRRVVLWSPTDGHAYAFNSEHLPLAAWVNYKCDVGQQNKMAKIRRASTLEEIVPLSISIRLEDTVQVNAKLRLPSSAGRREILNGPYVEAYDAILGPVLCSRDATLLSRLQNKEVVEVFAVYTEDYMKHSCWFAIAMNCGDESWTKLGELPDDLDDLTEAAFQSHISIDARDEYGTEQLETRSTKRNLSVQKVSPPEGLQVRRLSGGKIINVPALVVAHEELMSVLYTEFGLARLSGKQALGNWMMLNMLEDLVDDGQKPTVAYDHKSVYVVLEAEQMQRPMSTRVLRSGDQDRFLVCGVVSVERGYLYNQYIGEVNDSKKLVSDEFLNYGKKFLVEIALLHKTKKPRNPLFWQVVKFHGIAVKCINEVPLEDSIVPYEDSDVRLLPFKPISTKPDSSVHGFGTVESAEACTADFELLKKEQISVSSISSSGGVVKKKLQYGLMDGIRRSQHSPE